MVVNELSLFSLTESQHVFLAYPDFPLPSHNLELNADLNYNDDNTSLNHFSFNIHYQILLVYSIQFLFDSLVFSTQLVSGPDSHMTFSLENFFLIDSASYNPTILDTVYLEI